MDHMALEDYQLIISGIEKERFPKSNWNKFFKACEFTNYSWPLLKLLDDDVHVNIATLGETLARYRKKPRVYIGFMTRSSRHKSHKQSKHSSRDAREHSELESDVKMKERNSKEEGSGTVCRDSVSSEKRKDLSGHANGDASEDYVGSKRRKEKADLDRWNSCGDEMKVESSRIDGDKTSKSKALVDSKSKSSRKHDGGGGEKKEESVGLVGEKEESKSSSKVESKRKSEKDLGRKDKDSKEKKRVLEKKIHETEVTVDGEERQGKRGRENTDRRQTSKSAYQQIGDIHSKSSQRSSIDQLKPQRSSKEQFAKSFIFIPALYICLGLKVCLISS
ncbi:putative beta-1,3-galactosyltransferase 2 [Camellia lanceoleosa]|uniref:Beta-1,3-galactosyltransferase 2 n=1 Tax=Camellia lanceoleosa TaxID=1840588 RepID=A0ACC0FLI0_9ERIC|nr:putative beta-1,3-galactosyltransferase 2 [Camellia lanceoleosa]